MKSDWLFNSFYVTMIQHYNAKESIISRYLMNFYFIRRLENSYGSRTLYILLAFYYIVALNLHLLEEYKIKIVQNRIHIFGLICFMLFIPLHIFSKKKLKVIKFMNFDASLWRRLRHNDNGL